MKKAYPKVDSRLGWAVYYIARFNRNPNNKNAEHLALWYLFLVQWEIHG